jgi:hypothetical protein
MNKRELIIEELSSSDVVFLEGYDDCIIGACDDKIAYSSTKIINQLCAKLSFDDSLEWFQYNIQDSCDIIIIEDYLFSTQENAGKP